MPHSTAGIYIEATHATTIDLEIHGWVEEETLEPPVKGDHFFFDWMWDFFGGGWGGEEFSNPTTGNGFGIVCFDGGGNFIETKKTKNTKKNEVSNQLINVDMLEEHKQWESF